MFKTRYEVNLIIPKFKIHSKMTNFTNKINIIKFNSKIHKFIFWYWFIVWPDKIVNNKYYPTILMLLMLLFKTRITLIKQNIKNYKLTTMDYF